MNDPVFFILKAFFRKVNHRINEEELKLQLLGHPNFPALNSITDAFDHFGIDNVAAEVPADGDSLAQLPYCFLALVEKEGRKQLALVVKKGNEIKLTFDKSDTKSLTAPDFLKEWTGIVAVVEESSNTASSVVNPAVAFRKALPMITVLASLLAFFAFNPGLFQSIHFLLSIAGAFLSTLIIQHELGLNSKTLDKLCSTTENTSCDAVLNSKGASLFGAFKLSDAGLIYFTGLSVAWLLSVYGGNASLYTFAGITLLALPMTLFSIYYQWRVVKKWCPLCLGMVAVLWLQFATLFTTSFSLANFVVEVQGLTVVAIGFLIMGGLWAFVRPLLQKRKAFEELEIDHHKFKRNYGLFEAALFKEAPIYTQVVDLKEVVLGNPNDDALLKITAITNPLCFYCKEAHAVLEKLLEKGDGQVQIIVRFNISPDLENMGAQIGMRLLALYHHEGEAKCQEALHEVYGDIAPDQWLKKQQPVPQEGQYLEILAQSQQWCHAHDVNFTPAFFLNGRPFPKEYKITDLPYFVDEMIENERLGIRQLTSEPALN